MYLYTRSGTTWTQRAYVKGSNTERGRRVRQRRGAERRRQDHGGRRPQRGQRGARGLNGNQADNAADDSGAVYVFTN